MSHCRGISAVCRLPICTVEEWVQWRDGNHVTFGPYRHQKSQGMLGTLVFFSSAYLCSYQSGDDCSSQNQLQSGCDDWQGLQCRFSGISQLSHQTSRINANFCTIVWDPATHRTVLQDWACEAYLPMFSSICLELTTFTRHQQRLSDDLQISVQNLLI